MKTIEQILAEFIENGITKAFSDLDKSLIDIDVVSTNNPKFGDYQTNIAMKLKKHLDVKNPREIAQKILDGVNETVDNECLSKTEIAGPGFINMFLNTDWVAKRSLAVIQDERCGVPDKGHSKNIVIDYSSPNIAKTMHIGHLRSTVIGSSLYALLSFYGYNVIGDNHIGDWGTQFGKLIVAYRNWLDSEALNQDPVGELERLYVKFGQEAEKDPSLEEQARSELVKLQQGETDNTELWKEFVELSMKRFFEVYERLGVKFDVVYGESHYNPMLKDVLEELKQKGLAVKSEGAYVIYLEDYDLHPYLVQKSDGAFLYATTDIAGLKYRIDKWHPEKIVIVTDNRQEVHFKQLKAVAEKLSWDNETELVHVSFGRLNFGGKIMSTRKGNVIKLKELLDEAKNKARAVVDEASPHLSEEERDNIAETVGISTIKYFDLSQNRTSDLMFTWESALSLQGNTAPYLLYAYARIQSIFRKFEEKTGKSIDEVVNTCQINIVNNDEASVMKYALRFPQIVDVAVRTYKPSAVCDFIYNLSQEFNSFYNKHRVIDANDSTPESRILICKLVSDTLHKGLELLTINPLNRM